MLLVHLGSLSLEVSGLDQAELLGVFNNIMIFSMNIWSRHALHETHRIVHRHKITTLFEPPLQSSLLMPLLEHPVHRSTALGEGFAPFSFPPLQG